MSASRSEWNWKKIYLDSLSGLLRNKQIELLGDGDQANLDTDFNPVNIRVWVSMKCFCSLNLIKIVRTWTDPKILVISEMRFCDFALLFRDCCA